MTRDPSWISALKGEYQIGDKFLEAYLNFFEGGGTKLHTAENLQTLSETQKMWFYYALSTNLRARDMVKEISQVTSIRGKRYLDIGCGFGGFPLAFSRAGADSVGIDIDAERIAFAKKNVSDFGLDIPILHQDLLDERIIEKIGTFDIITANDVIEHVLDVPRAFRMLSRLLNDDGLVYLEIPNKHSVDFVLSDGHYNLFGITLLDRLDALRYYHQKFSYEYGVGYYFTLEEYQVSLSENAIQSQLIDSLYHPTDSIEVAEEKIKLIELALEGFRADAVINNSTKQLVEAEINNYLESVRKDLKRVHERSDVNLDQYFKTRYLRKFYTLQGRKLGAYHQE